MMARRYVRTGAGPGLDHGGRRDLPAVAPARFRQCVRRPASWVIGAAVSVATAAVIAGSAGARSASNVCSTLGLDSGAVRTAYGVQKEIAHQEGTPVCEVATKHGMAYAAVYPMNDAADLVASWEFGIQFQKRALSGLGNNASLFYTAAYQQVAIGFSEGPHFVWLTTGSRYMHSDVLALAGVIYAKLG
jgi:hypothetical protein